MTAVVRSDLPPEGGVPRAAELVRSGVSVVFALAPGHGGAVVGAALRAGVRVFVDVEADEDALARARDAAARGDLLLAPRAVAGVRQLAGAGAVARDPFPELSHREREVLAYMTADVDVRRLAGWLGLTPNTVRHHVGRIVAKLGATDPAEAARRARQAGYVRPRRNAGGGG